MEATKELGDVISHLEHPSKDPKSEIPFDVAADQCQKLFGVC